MKSFFANLWEFAFRNGRTAALERRDVIFYAMAFLALLLGFLILVDVYLFYISYVRPRPPVPVSHRAVTLAPQDIDEAIRLLDEREQKLQSLLGEGE